MIRQVVNNRLSRALYFEIKQGFSHQTCKSVIVQCRTVISGACMSHSGPRIQLNTLTSTMLAQGDHGIEGSWKLWRDLFHCKEEWGKSLFCASYSSTLWSCWGLVDKSQARQNKYWRKIHPSIYLSIFFQFLASLTPTHILFTRHCPTQYSNGVMPHTHISIPTHTLNKRSTVVRRTPHHREIRLLHSHWVGTFVCVRSDASHTHTHGSGA